MNLADGFLALARRLTHPDPDWPRQVGFRRAVSTAYYALFHLLTEEFARLFVQNDPGLLSRVTRTVDHKPLKDASALFSKSRITLPKSLQPKNGQFEVPEDLLTVTEAVSQLQEERELADYDRARRLTQTEAQLAVAQAEVAFQAWERIRHTDAARLFLGCFLLRDHWNKPPRERAGTGNA